MKYIWILLCLATSFISCASDAMQPFNKVIIWGHKLYSHTHSYVHNAFYRTFQHLGYDTYWLDNSDDVSHIDLSNSLFLTEGQVDGNIPLREDCYYILHNCRIDKYRTLYNNGNVLCLQVYTHDCLARDVEKIDACIYYQSNARTLYMPWATDLLPHEINAIKEEIAHKKRDNIIYWVGTFGDGYFGNRDQINPFIRAGEKNGVRFQSLGGISPEQNIDLIQRSYMAPTIVGKWQNEKGYIPCRIFKNISYGQMGITNSKTVSDLFKGKIVYNEDPYQLFLDAQKYIEDMNIDELYNLMDLVRDKHTYINRVEHLLHFLMKK